MRRSAKISDLYQSDIERHLFAPESRTEREPVVGHWRTTWLSIAAAALVWWRLVVF